MIIREEEEEGQRGERGGRRSECDYVGMSSKVDNF